MENQGFNNVMENNNVEEYFDPAVNNTNTLNNEIPQMNLPESFENNKNTMNIDNVISNEENNINIATNQVVTEEINQNNVNGVTDEKMVLEEIE